MNNTQRSHALTDLVAEMLLQQGALGFAGTVILKPCAFRQWMGWLDFHPQPRHAIARSDNANHGRLAFNSFTFSRFAALRAALPSLSRVGILRGIMRHADDPTGGWAQYQQLPRCSPERCACQVEL